MENRLSYYVLITLSSYVLITLSSLMFSSTQAALPPLQEKLQETKTSLERLQSNLQDLATSLQTLKTKLTTPIEVLVTRARGSNKTTITLEDTAYTFDDDREDSQRWVNLGKAINANQDFLDKLEAMGTGELKISVTIKDGTPEGTRGRGQARGRTRGMRVRGGKGGSNPIPQPTTRGGRGRGSSSETTTPYGGQRGRGRGRGGFLEQRMQELENEISKILKKIRARYTPKP